MKIKIGAVQIATWEPSSKRMFSFNYYYDKNDDFHGSDEEREVKECDPDEVVLPPNKEYTLVIDYPTSVPYKAKIKTGKRGITRLKLADKICKHYGKMYREEDKTAGGDPGHISGMMNRNQSGGKYGIWGHDIGDLVLVDAVVYKNGNIHLGVDS